MKYYPPAEKEKNLIEKLYDVGRELPSGVKLGLTAIATAGLITLGSLLSRPSKPVQPIPTKRIESVVTPTRTPRPTPTSAPRWQQIGLQGENVSDIAVAHDGIIYTGTNGNYHGIFKSSDNGETWKAVNNGLGGLDIIRVIVSSESSDVVYTSAESRVWKTENGGKFWSPCSNRIDLGPLAISPSNVLYLTNNYTLGGASGKIFQSTDKCSSWQELGSLKEQYLSFLQLYAVPHNQNILYAVDNGGQVRKSIDNGASWLRGAAVGPEHKVSCLSINPKNPEIVFVGAYEKGWDGTGMGVYKSRDGGGSWIPVNNTLPNQGNGVEVTALLYDPIETQTVYSALNIDGDTGVYRTSNEGESWEKLGPAIGHVNVLSVNPNNPSVLCAGTDNGIWTYDLTR